MNPIFINAETTVAARAKKLFSGVLSMGAFLISIHVSAQDANSGHTEKVSAGCEIPVQFANLGLSIPDGNFAGITNTQNVSNVAGTALGVDIKLKAVCFDITHTWVGDLVVKLIGPGGTQVVLTDRPGFPASFIGCDGDDISACVVRGTGNSMENTCNNLPAISGNYTAHVGSDLNDFNSTGLNPNGTWELQVIDVSLSDTGSVSGWTLVFDNGPIASWNAPDSVCQSSPVTDLTTLVTGTAGGTWSGTGVSGSNFNPAGLSGPVAITYAVTSIITGCTDSSTAIVQVIPPPVSAFTFSYISNNIVSFTNTSTGSNTFQWTFGDNTSSLLPNPIHTYSAPGTYSVVLTATNFCGPVTSTQNVIIQPTGIDDPNAGYPAFIAYDNEEKTLQFNSGTLPSGKYNCLLSDVLGRVALKSTVQIGASSESIRINTGDLTDGIYFFSLEQPGTRLVYKLYISQS